MKKEVGVAGQQHKEIQKINEMKYKDLNVELRENPNIALRSS